MLSQGKNHHWVHRQRLKHLKCVTIEKDNYFSWRAQFSTLFRRYKLLNYVKGKVPSNRTSWILTAILPSILPQVASLTILTEVWDSLRQMHSSSSEMRLLYLRFQNLLKNNLSMSDDIKKMCIATKDLLASVGEKMRDSQLGCQLKLCSCCVVSNFMSCRVDTDSIVSCSYQWKN